MNAISAKVIHRKYLFVPRMSARVKKEIDILIAKNVKLKVIILNWPHILEADCCSLVRNWRCRPKPDATSLYSNAFPIRLRP